MRFFKGIGIILFIALLQMNVLSSIAIYVHFRINQDFIAKYLCINRDEPITMCGGKCYLDDRLKQNSGKEEENSFTIEFRLVEYIDGEHYPKNLKPFDPSDTCVIPVFDQHLMPLSFWPQVFHPPRNILHTS